MISLCMEKKKSDVRVMPSADRLIGPFRISSYVFSVKFRSTNAINILKTFFYLLTNKIFINVFN